MRYINITVTTTHLDKARVMCQEWGTSGDHCLLAVASREHFQVPCTAFSASIRVKANEGLQLWIPMQGASRRTHANMVQWFDTLQYDKIRSILPHTIAYTRP